MKLKEGDLIICGIPFNESFSDLSLERVIFQITSICPDIDAIYGFVKCLLGECPWITQYGITDEYWTRSKYVEEKITPENFDKYILDLL